MLASSYLVFFLCCLVLSSLFFVVTLQFQSPVVNPRPKKPQKPQKRVGTSNRAPVKSQNKSKRANKRKRKRKTQETPIKTPVKTAIILPSPPLEKVVPDNPAQPKPPSPEIHFPPPKQVKNETEVFTAKEEPKHVEPTIIPQIERLASTSPEPKSDTSSEFDFLIVDAKETETLEESKCLEMDRDRSNSDSNLLSKANSKRKPPLVYNSPPYNEKNLKQQKKQKREKAETNADATTVTKTSQTEYASEKEDKSPSPQTSEHGGESSSSSESAPSAKTTESFEKERVPSREPTPTRTENRIPSSHSPTFSHSYSNPTVKRSLSTRSLPSHSPRRHFSKSSSSPNALQGSNMQSNHRQSRRHLRRQKKKKHRGPSRSYSHSHLQHVHPQYSMPVQNNRYQPQFNAHMPHFPQTIQMQTFVPPPQLLQTFPGNIAEFDQNNVLHPLQQIKPDGAGLQQMKPDVGVSHQHSPQLHHAFMPSPQMQPQFIMTEIQQPHIPIVHQPQLPPQPLSPQVVLQPVPMSPHHSGGLSQVSLNSIPSPHVFFQPSPHPHPPMVPAYSS